MQVRTDHPPLDVGGEVVDLALQVDARADKVIAHHIDPGEVCLEVGYLLVGLGDALFEPFLPSVELLLEAVELLPEAVEPLQHSPVNLPQQPAEHPQGKGGHQDRQGDQDRWMTK